MCCTIVCVPVVFKKDVGPGPAHAIDPAMTNHGRDGNPHYSLASRHKELTPFRTPGPGTYAPETKRTCFQGEKYPPVYSMSARSRYRKSKPNLCLCVINFVCYVCT
jgi:hypothetical protein